MEELFKKVFAVFWNMAWKIKVLINNIEEKNLSVIIIIRRNASEHLIDQNTK